jgi:acetyltransferase EpsM
MIKIIIFGSGSHAKVIYSEIIKKKKFKFLGFVDENEKKGKKIITGKKNYYNLGNMSQVLSKKNNIKGIIGIGSNFLRKKVSQDILLIDKNFKFEKIISKDAIIDTSVIIGQGSFVVSGSVINIGTKIGDHCIINTSSSIDHDNIFEDFASTGPGVKTGGHVTLETKSHIGIGSSVKHGVKIFKDCIIGANSYVNKNCEKNSLYFGSPIKKIKQRKEFENYL